MLIGEVMGMNAYCLFCTTAKRDEVAQKLRRKYGWHILCPKLIQRKWVRGTALEMLREYLPGYLFIYADAPIENPLALRREDFVIRCLGAPDCGYVLQGGELEVISCAVIGGTLLTGGVGYMIGTMFGVLLKSVIPALISFYGSLSSWWGKIATGALLLLFIVIQRAVVSYTGRKKK
jgi:hypothetical protein